VFTREFLGDLTPVGRCGIVFVVKELNTSDRSHTYSYAEFRALADLTKKEADGWTKSGVIRAELMPNGKRRYGFNSIVEGIIAKQLADFSSRTLLPNMMEELRKFLKSEKIDLVRLDPDPAAGKLLVQLYTRHSKEVMAGGGVRGVLTYARRFDPRSGSIAKTVFLIIELGAVVLAARTGIERLKAA
jgi:hypothetical protein